MKYIANLRKSMGILRVCMRKSIGFLMKSIGNLWGSIGILRGVL